MIFRANVYTSNEVHDYKAVQGHLAPTKAIYLLYKNLENLTGIYFLYFVLLVQIRNSYLKINRDGTRVNIVSR